MKKSLQEKKCQFLPKQTREKKGNTSVNIKKKTTLLHWWVVIETWAVVIGNWKGRLGMTCFMLLDQSLVGQYQAQFEGID